MKLNHQVMMISGGITGFGAASEYTDTSEIWTGSEWRFTTGKLPYTARDVKMAFIDNRILYLGKYKNIIYPQDNNQFKRWNGFFINKAQRYFELQPRE